jgi:phage tail tape measure protein, TP901 family
MASDSYMAMEVQVDLKDAISKLSSLADKIKDLSETTEKSGEKNEKFKESFNQAAKVLSETGQKLEKTKNKMQGMEKETEKSGKSADKTGKEFDDMGNSAENAGEKGKKGLKKLSDEADNAKKKTSMFGEIFKADLAVAAVKKVGKAIFDFGKDAITTTVGFQKNMNEVFTMLPNITQPEMAKLKNDILDLSDKFGVLPEKTVPALYQALSAGVPQNNVMTFLETAQKGAVAGVSDVSTAVDGLSSVVNAWGEKNITAAQASDLMFTAVKEGKTTFGEIAGSISKVGPLAASLGVQFSDVTAALASMTAKGTPTEVAMTQLKAAFSELSQGSSKVSKEFQKATGGSFKDFIAKGGDLQGALKILDERARKSGKGINELFGSVDAAQVALSLTGEGAKGFAEDLEAMKNSIGATDNAFNTMNQGIGPTWDKLTTRMTTRMIRLGDSMASTIEKIGNAVLGIFPYLDQMGAAFQSPMFLEFVRLLSEIGATVGSILMPALMQLGGVIGGALMSVFQNFMANGEQFKTIFEGISNILVILGGAIVEVFLEITGIFNIVVSAVAGFASAFLQYSGLAGGHSKQLASNISQAFTTIGQIISGVYNFIAPIINFLAQLLGAVLGWAVKGLVELFGLLGQAINSVGGFFKKLFNKKDAEESKNAIKDVNKELQDLGKSAEKGATANVEVNKKETIDTTVNFKPGDMPPIVTSQPQNLPPQKVEFDTKNLSADLQGIGNSIQNNPADQTRNNKLSEIKSEFPALKAEITAMKNIISQKLDAVANAIKNRNLVLNVHGLTPDEVIARIKAAIEKG